MRSLIIAAASAAACLLAACSQTEDTAAPTETAAAEILWDQYGVPHIYADSAEDADFAFGRAQMENHSNLLLKLYATSRGQAAEYWGKDYLASDTMVHKLGLPARADALLAAQGPEFAARLTAFADGINAWATENPDAIDADKQAVLPVRPQDVLLQMQYSIHVTFVAGRAQAIAQGWSAADEKPGSNAWAIAPSRSQSGNAMLLMNPHLPWQNQYLFYEAHISVPGYDAYGVSLVGMPTLVIAFNKDLGWTHTVNTYDGSDLYELTLTEGGYLLDDTVTPFEETNTSIKVRQADGTMEERTITLRRSIHGPVISQNDEKALALRVAGLEEPEHNRMFEQYWRMGSAQNVDEYEAALSMHQVPMFNAVYADRHGDIFYAFNALQPVRSEGDVAFWSGIVDGTRSDLAWQGYRAYDELPRYRNPPSGFVQNANDPPWTSTFPRAVEAKDYPADIAPQWMPFRPQNSAMMLMNDESVSWDELMQYRQSTRAIMADRVLDDLTIAAEDSDDPLVAEAMRVLAAWDREMLPASKGAFLFYKWAEQIGIRAIYDGSFFATPWSPDAPLTTPNGIADPIAAVAALSRAAASVQEKHGSLDVAWGDAVRVRYAGQDHPSSVAPGVTGAFRVAFMGREGEDGIVPVAGGNSFVAAVEFGDRIRAAGILGPGNTTEPKRSHYGNQLGLHARGDFRDILFYREDVEVGAVRRDAIRR